MAAVRYPAAAPFHGRAASPPPTLLYVSSPIPGRGSKRAVATPLRGRPAWRCRWSLRTPRILHGNAEEVVIEEHADKYAVEPADCWHSARLILSSRGLVPTRRLACRSEGSRTRSPSAAVSLRRSPGKNAGRRIPPSFVVEKVRHALTQTLLRYGYRIVKIHRTRGLHAVFFVQPHFRRNPSDGGRDRRDRRRGQVSESAVAGKYYDWPGFVRRSKTVKPNVAPGYSSGQIASASQPDRSPESPRPAS